MRELPPPIPDPRRSYSLEGAIGTICGARLERAVPLSGAAGAPPLPWIGPPKHSSAAGPSDAETEPSCSTLVYRRFFAGRDTVSFTVGRSAEECNDVPRLLLHSGNVREGAVPVWPLYDRNVECLWCTPRYLVFGLVQQGEGGPDHDRIACWRVGTHEWYWTPERADLMHRPGFDLASLVPDWRTARVIEAGEAVVIRGRERAVALWPREQVWSLVNAATGAPIPAARHVVSRRIIAGEQAKLAAALTSQIQSKFREKDPTFDPLDVLEIVTEPCRAHRDSRALIAHSVVHGAAQRGVRRDPSTGALRLDEEMFGVFLVDSTLTRLEATLGMFPTGRWLDETAYFDPEASDDSVVVWGEGATYGDVGTRLAYPCAP